MSDELKGIATGTCLILAAIVAGYIKLRKNAMAEKEKGQQLNNKDRAAGQKIDQSAYDHLIEKYKDLIEDGKVELRKEIGELREQVKHYQEEHYDCAKKLVVANARIEVLESREKERTTREAQPKRT